MFNHVLLPTDGSKLSEDAIRMGVHRVCRGTWVRSELSWRRTAGRACEAVLLGSETQKVLTHSHVPVLVCRPQ